MMPKIQRPRADEPEAVEDRIVGRIDPAARPSIVATIQPLAYRIATVARLLDVSERTIDRLISAGKFPPADAHAGRGRLWKAATIEGWLEQGGGRR